MGSGIQMEESGMAKVKGHAAGHHDRGLMAIGVVKLVEAVFFLLVGIGVIHFIHRDLGNTALRLAERLKLDLGGRLMTWVLGHLDDVTARRLKQIGIFTFFYAGLRVVEGVGLVMEKVWAEYLTVGATTIFLPWEIYEIAKHADWIRVCLLLGNLTVLAYLVWNLRRSRAGKMMLAR